MRVREKGGGGNRNRGGKGGEEFARFETAAKIFVKGQPPHIPPFFPFSCTPRRGVYKGGRGSSRFLISESEKVLLSLTRWSAGKVFLFDCSFTTSFFLI